MKEEEEEEEEEERIYRELSRKYLLVFLTACFADWLQGPYLYSLYTSYGYNADDISLLYMAGFTSSTVFGICVGHLADKIGRKHLCVAYSVLYSVSCLAMISRNFWILATGRLFGGISTSILFSSFESWYVGRHLSTLPLNREWIGVTLTKSTFYNSLSAMVAGCASSIFADKFNLGPLAPSLLALPVLTVCGCLCAFSWEKGQTLDATVKNLSWTDSLQLIFSKNNKLLLHLGTIQCLFEAVMYTFVFLWTPVLDPIEPSHGFVFCSFMLCVMFGSRLHSSLLLKYRLSHESSLKVSVLFGLCGIAGSLFGTYLQSLELSERSGTYVCLLSFLCYEVAVGMYYPAIGYLRSVVVPEPHRASIANWFRLPTNLLTCSVLFYIRSQQPRHYDIFSISLVALALATMSCFRFARMYARNISRYDRHFKTILELSDDVL